MGLQIPKQKRGMAWLVLCFAIGIAGGIQSTTVHKVHAAQQSYVVTTTADSGAGSLRHLLVPHDRAADALDTLRRLAAG